MELLNQSSRVSFLTPPLLMFLETFPKFINSREFMGIYNFVWTPNSNNNKNYMKMKNLYSANMYNARISNRPILLDLEWAKLH